MSNNFKNFFSNVLYKFIKQLIFLAPQPQFATSVRSENLKCD